MSAAAHDGETIVTLFRASDGDCILMRCIDGKDSFNVLVDAGRASTVARLKRFMKDLPESQRRIDLFVVTHIDADHIAGAIALARDAGLARMVRAVWFNDASHLVPQDDIPLSIAQGNTFAKLIRKNGWAWNEAADGGAIVRKRGMRSIVLDKTRAVSVRLLGPLPSGLEALADRWPAEPDEPEEDEGEPSEIAMGNKRAPDVEALAGADYDADDTVPNQSSIAFVLSHGSRRILIGADSHAETLVTAIDEDFAGHLEVEVATLPHHGSRRNTSVELAERVSAATWTVSTQGGGKHLFPNGESIARILTHKASDNRPRFVFNSGHREALVWDHARTKKTYGYSTAYPDDEDEWITFSIAGKADPS